MKLTIIGAGPGGYEAAIYAAKKGLEVILIEKDSPGGTCLNRGCIPTKAFIASMETLEYISDAEDFGIYIDGEVKINYEEIVSRKDKVMNSLVKGIKILLKKNGVKLIEGFGKIVDKNTVEVTKPDGEKETVTSDNIILATGSVPTLPALFCYDGKRVISSNEILDLKTLPRSIAIIGGGVIGCEIGQFLSRMGSEVTIIEMQDRILSTCDEDVVKPLLRQFKKDKIKVITSDGVSAVEVTEDSVKLTLTSGKEVNSEYALVAVGRKPFTENLGLQNAGVELDERGYVKVNGYLQTTAENIYAIGDILPTTQLAHVASKEGFTAVDNILGKKKTVNYDAVPACIFTSPQIATVGKCEYELEEGTYKVGTFDFKALGKAQASSHIFGFAKVITDNDDRIIGGAVTGQNASDMLSVITTAVTLGLTSEELSDVIYPHPTMSEAVMEALHDLHGMSINKA